MVDWDYGEENPPFESKTSSAEILSYEANLCFPCLSFFYYVWRWEDSLIFIISSVFGLLAAERLVAVFIVKPMPHRVFCLLDWEAWLMFSALSHISSLEKLPETRFKRGLCIIKRIGEWKMSCYSIISLPARGCSSDTAIATYWAFWPGGSFHG